MDYMGPQLNVQVADLLILLYNMRRGADHPQVGYEDAYRTMQQLINEVNKMTRVSKDTIEALLWSSNLLNEVGEFWHPNKLTFNTFVKRINKGAVWNSKFNFFEDR